VVSVELIYELTCPNVRDARDVLRKALKQAKLAPIWKEWEVNHPDTPNHLRKYGSPTILVNDLDVAGEFTTDNSACCRIYHDSHAVNRGVPSVNSVVEMLLKMQQKKDKADPNKYRMNVAVIPSIGSALLPKLACPTCWPAYAGLLSSMGLGFFDYTPYLIPMTLIFIVIALLSMAYKANNRRGYPPLFLGFAASATIIFGKFYLDSDSTMYGGIVLLVIASLWNTWPKKLMSDTTCQTCNQLDAQH